MEYICENCTDTFEIEADAIAHSNMFEHTLEISDHELELEID